MARHKNVIEVTKMLLKVYGHQFLGNKKNPFSELVFILLSSKTPPERYQSAYLRLKRHYPKSDDLAMANWDALAELIKDTGLQNRKAKALVKISQRIKRERGEVSLAFLKHWSDDDAENYLCSLPEISKKSARCILMYSLDRQVFPVDNHCFRICQRLGWVGENASLSDRVSDLLQDGVPLELRKDLHVCMVLLGRDFCTPTNPDCAHCPILSFCPAGQSGLLTSSV